MSIDRPTEGPKPIKEFKPEVIYQLYNIEDLSEDERLAVQEAMRECKLSDNFEFKAGAAAVANDGFRVACHNESVKDEGTGQEGHAEMLALAALYRGAPSGRSLKILALAASDPHEDLVHIAEEYGADVELNDIEGERICGRCLKFISDYTGNFISSETGKNEDKSDITLLTVTATGQVLRSSLRTLHPLPHRPRRIPLKPLERGLKGAPDSFGANGK